MQFSSEEQLLEIQSSTDNFMADWEEPRDEKRKKSDKNVEDGRKHRPFHGQSSGW